MNIFRQADDLKTKINKKCDWLNNAEVWANQQKLQTIYHQVLVLDLEYALDKKVEQDLWNIGFKNHISSLQEQTRDKRVRHLLYNLIFCIDFIFRTLTEQTAKHY